MHPSELSRSMMEVVLLVSVSPYLLLGCGADASGDPTGSVQLFVVPEETIAEGLDPGVGPENIRDGWTIRYDRYLVTVGNFRAERTDTGSTLRDPTVYVLDLRHAPTSGYLVKEFRDVAAVRWDRFAYDVPNARGDVSRVSPTKQADVDFMLDHHYSVYYEGYGEKGEDRIAFGFGFSAGTRFGDCTTEDGIPGFAVPAGGTVQVKPTLHGDHQYFDNVTQGVEITERRAEWLSACNADSDGVLTLDELKECDATTALPSPPYDVTAVVDRDGDGTLTVYDYVDSQMRTFGDYQGDGECPTRRPLE